MNLESRVWRKSVPLAIELITLVCVPLGFAQSSFHGTAGSAGLHNRVDGFADHDTYKTYSPTVVLIETYGDDGKASGAGSGFIVSPDGRILTNYHVIAHTKRAIVRLANDDAYDSVEVLEIDKRKDIALIKIKAINQAVVKPGRSSSMQVGDRLYTLGTPLGVFQNTLSDRILSGIRQMDGYKLFQLSAPISHRSSGSPVFNSAGEVIAIVEATIGEGQNLNFAIPIDSALGMLDSRQTRSLESIYEPEEPKSAKEPASSPDPTHAPRVPPAVASPASAMKSDPLTYISTGVGIWTREDAEVELGPALDRRDAVFNNSVIGDIFKYKVPYSGFGTIELNINRSSRRLTAAYFYYRNTVTWAEVKQKLGKNYKKQKLANGRPGFIYQFGNRQFCVIVDSAENIYNVGVW
jgi:V8-like Glu-specific endopeptidase